MRSSEVRSVLERLTPPVYRFCLHLTGDPHLGEDLAQDTMLRAWTHQERLRDEAGATAWLFTIARNAWLDDRRRAKVRSRANRRLARALPQSLPRGSSRVEVDEGIVLVREAMAGLPERQRDVLFLSAMEGLSHAQVAQVLGVSAGAVKASLSLARQRVADAVDERRGVSIPGAEVEL